MCRLEKLTDEELVERIRAGETSCMDILIERYKRQVRNQARTLYLIGGDSDDLIPGGNAGTVQGNPGLQAGEGGLL